MNLDYLPAADTNAGRRVIRDPAELLDRWLSDQERVLQHWLKRYQSTPTKSPQSE